MSRARFLALSATLFAVLLVPSRPSLACSCVFRELAEQVAASTTVFLGAVREATESDVTFDVDRVFKGDSPGSHPISNAGASSGAVSTCAVPFAEGRRYVVFASVQDEVLTTNICTGTTDDLSIVSRLSVGSSPTPRAAPTKIVVVVASRAWPIAAAAAMVAIVAAVALLAIRAGRRPRPIS